MLGEKTASSTAPSSFFDTSYKRKWHFVYIERIYGRNLLNWDCLLEPCIFNIIDFEKEDLIRMSVC